MTETWPLKRGDLRCTSERRRAFRELLARAGIGSRDGAYELVFGELVTNAVRYGDDPMRVKVRLESECVQIQIQDSGDCFDLRQAMLKKPTTTGGRGLQIVRALASSLTVERTTREECEITAVIPI